jgi:8-hydroxy-5-deazaflavin:NADPH oxidoreductase
MKIGIIGSGTVAQTLASKLLEVGHSVTISSRDISKAKDPGPMGALASADEWAAAQRGKGHEAAAAGFAAAAASGELVINATLGSASLAALQAAGADNLRGKILVDVSNPLDFSNGMPPTLTVCNTDSLAEQIQAAFPATRVVKTLNTVTAALMVDPGRLGEETDIFVAGNDAEAKEWVTQHFLRESLGWTRVIDLGDITAARGAEMYLPLWLRLLGATGTGVLNMRVVTEAAREPA